MPDQQKQAARVGRLVGKPVVCGSRLCMRGRKTWLEGLLRVLVRACTAMRLRGLL